MSKFWVPLLFLVFGSSCGRYFAGPVRPLSETQQEAHMVVRDDGTVAYVFERLEIGLRPLTDTELNRNFASHSNKGVASTNPYTYGNWTPMGDEWTPPRFTVFLLTVKNYAYPKVKVDPGMITLRAEDGRTFPTLNFFELSEYHRAYALAWAGNTYALYKERKELLRKTLFAAKMVFSGQEDDGYIVFPTLPPDVESFGLEIDDLAVRFNYADQPVETLDLTYRFGRDVFRGYQPPAELTEAK